MFDFRCQQCGHDPVTVKRWTELAGVGEVPWTWCPVCKHKALIRPCGQANQLVYLRNGVDTNEFVEQVYQAASNPDSGFDALIGTGDPERFAVELNTIDIQETVRIAIQIHSLFPQLTSPEVVRVPER